MRLTIVGLAEDVRVVVDLDLVAVRERVGDLGDERAGVALVAVGARERQLEPDVVPVLEGRRRPDVLVEADRAAVERVRRIVDREVIGDPVERERAPGDAVRVAAGDAAEVRAALDVVVEVVEAERDVRAVAVAVRHPTDWMIPPYVMILTSMPREFVSV